MNTARNACLICDDGTQKSVVDSMQARADLYRCVNDHDSEAKLDQLFARERRRGE